MFFFIKTFETLKRKSSSGKAPDAIHNIDSQQSSSIY